MMHDIVEREVKWWLDVFRPEKVADLGSCNLNGNTGEFYPHVTGFDLIAGKGVDVVLPEDGTIPTDHRERYGCVVATSSFQCSPTPEMFKREVLALLRVHGVLILTACHPSCTCTHSSSSHRTPDHLRFSLQMLKDLLAPEMRTICGYIKGEAPAHRDIVLIGVKNG